MASYLINEILCFFGFCLLSYDLRCNYKIFASCEVFYLKIGHDIFIYEFPLFYIFRKKSINIFLVSENSMPSNFGCLFELCLIYDIEILFYVKMFYLEMNRKC